MTNPPSPGDAQYTPPADPATNPAAYPVAGPGYATPPAAAPGNGLAIAGLVLAFVIAPLGLILSIVAAVKLGKAGAPKGIAIAGIIIGAIITVIAVIGLVLLVTVFANLFSMCAELGPGVWQVDGVTYTCN
ncbi:hypothetical protein JOF42_001409 [Microbacterium phyllosphaerae]|uniref:DUF4190 domain-containing protein n=1 Tax=Microbacterium phyllosphaerae TaxID=124798 RepID=A0ABS4WNX9_9MICO|nr:DUF4190 domain-containing protein [Microbacterium phyllosphaerae]MBP2377914.1 hypothetical protein [Microbacterium phyllosphaerae]MCS3442095.1 hypothetical protein [Microbacterium phyllosphaerae]